MRTAYFDCFSGAAGNMILAALIDAGWETDALRAVVAELKLPGVEVVSQKVRRHGIAATHVDVRISEKEQHGHRHLPQIVRIIDQAGLPAAVAENARRVFRRLAEAEAKVHDTTVEKVHFHEVGAADAIVDIVGACAGLAQLGVERVICSPIPTGHGTVTCEHGVMPVPAPATAELLAGVPLAACDEAGELTTPTGAAILTTLAAEFGPPPAIRLTATGYGAGTREGRTRANLLRVLIGEGEAAAGGDEYDTVAVLETQLDDTTGQVVAYVSGRLLEAGALDVFAVPIIMKKGRPGQLLTVLCAPGETARLEEIVFAETGTLGIRRSLTTRRKLSREHVTVETRFGRIRVKVGRGGGGTERGWPEYEDCAAAARAHGVSLRMVQQAAQAAWAESNAPG